MRRSKYGPAILGQEEYDRQLVVANATGNGTYGPAVTGQAGEEVPPLELAGAAHPGDGTLSIKDLGALLAEDAHTLDRQIDAEFSRAEGARKGAVRLFIQYETGREGGPRPTVLDALETGLTQL